jgi:3-oxoacyl-[acyl-carrier protein] reductase
MKHALVTGASRGIGRQITVELLNQNFRVTGTARATGFPEEMSSIRAFRGIHADLADPLSLGATLKPIFEKDLPGVLVNNAGIFRKADFSVSDEEWLASWDETFQVNLRASSLLCKWFINSHIQQSTGGIIINIASRAAYRGDNQEYAAYAATKGGMVAFTKSIARDFGKNGIIAYSIAPGFVETDMAKDSIEELGIDYLTRESSFNSLAQPEEVASLVSFLASGKVKHMTGSTFHINGGSYMI